MQKARSRLVGALPSEAGRSWENPFGFDSAPKLVSKRSRLLCQCRWNINKYESKSRSNSVILLVRLGLCSHRLLMCVGTTGPRSQFVSLTFWSEGFQRSGAERLSRFIFRNREARLLGLFRSTAGWGGGGGRKTASGGRGNIPSNYLEVLPKPSWPRTWKQGGPRHEADPKVLGDAVRTSASRL